MGANRLSLLIYAYATAHSRPKCDLHLPATLSLEGLGIAKREQGSALRGAKTVSDLGRRLTKSTVALLRRIGSQHKAMRRFLLTRRLSSASTRGLGEQGPFVLDEESLVFAVGIV